MEKEVWQMTGYELEMELLRLREEKNMQWRLENMEMFHEAENQMQEVFNEIRYRREQS